MRFAWTALISIALITLLAGTAVSNIPDPNTSTCDLCLGRSPNNSTADPSAQYIYLCTLRNTFGDPIPGYPMGNVTLNIDAPCANPITGLNPDADSNASGEIFWGVAALNQGGGACDSPGVVRIEVSALPFKSLDDVRSPDMDGDTFVALGDLATWQQAFVAQTPIWEGDLDCDGFIALSDLAVWQKHFVAP